MFCFWDWGIVKAMDFVDWCNLYVFNFITY